MMDIKAEIEDLMPKSKVFKEDGMKILNLRTPGIISTEHDKKQTIGG